MQQALLVTVLASLGLLGLGEAHGDTPARAGLGPELVPGSFIIRWKRGARPRAVDRVAGRWVRSARAIGERSWVYRLDETTARASREAIEELRRAPLDEVAEVVPVYYRYPSRVPNDPWYKVQWNLKAARLDRAWDLTTGVRGVKVAVIDTGILTKHPDIAAQRIVGGYDFVSNLQAAADGDGWDPDPSDPGTDSSGSSGLHGTHVAGVIGAASNNGVGITGADWNCVIVPVRALGATDGGRGDDADISAAIRWAAGLPIAGVENNHHPAHIINLSFGAPGDNSELRQAVLEAQERGSLVVAAAGNSQSDATDIFPGAYKDVITVGATGFDNQRTSYSNYGRVVEIMAPGGDCTQPLPGTSATECNQQPCVAGIYSLYRQGIEFGYGCLEGTSQAAPLVTGVLSMMVSIKPGMGIREATYILRETANHGSMCPNGCGAGLIDAEAAVAMTGGRRLPNNSRAPFAVPPETIVGSCAAAGSGAMPAGMLPILLLGLIPLLRRRRPDRRGPAAPRP